MKTDPTDEHQVRALCDRVMRGIHARNLDEVMAAYADDVVQYDVRSPLAQHGADAVRTTTKAWFDGYEGPIECEMRGLTIATGGDVAFARALNHTAGTAKDGRRLEMWVRWTAGFRKVGGAWKVVHEHVSVPFDPKTMKAELGLTP